MALRGQSQQPSKKVIPVIGTNRPLDPARPIARWHRPSSPCDAQPLHMTIAVHMENLEPQLPQQTVSIRIEYGTHIQEHKYNVDPAQLEVTRRELGQVQVDIGKDVVGGDLLRLPISAIPPFGGVGFGGGTGSLGSLLGWILGPLGVFTETVKVFINTPLAGAVLGVITKEVIEHICKAIRKQISDSGTKRKVKVVLYGPDGKEIKWE